MKSMAMVAAMLLAAALLALSASASCGGNSYNCEGSQCVCGSTPHSVDIASYCSTFSDWSQSCCECIARHESGGNANAVNCNSNGSIDAGLYQINSVNWASCSGGSAPCNPSTNVQCAHKVWQWGGNTWRLWSTCSACGCCGSH